jgi:SAM-dependent methyltransferase
MHPIASIGFKKAGAIYHKSRPSYPPQVFQYIKSLLTTSKKDTGTIVDVAAGTGKFTIGLFETFPNAKIIALEPVDEMRKNIPNEITKIKGFADKMPFMKQSVDVLTAAQSFHWFNNLDTLQEFHRVLRKDGHLILLWNYEREDLVPESDGNWFRDVKVAYEAKEKNEVPQYRTGAWKMVWESKEAENLFSLPLKHWQFRWNDYLTENELWHRIASKSYVSRLPSHEFNTLETGIRLLMKQAPHEQGKLVIPYSTDVYYTRPIGQTQK